MAPPYFHCSSWITWHGFSFLEGGTGRAGPFSELTPFRDGDGEHCRETEKSTPTVCVTAKLSLFGDELSPIFLYCLHECESGHCAVFAKRARTKFPSLAIWFVENS
jgi:hypothetical protein